MTNLDELRKRYKPLAEVKVPEETRERVYKMIENYEIVKPTKTAKTRRNVFLSSIAAVAMVAAIVGGVSYQTHSPATTAHPPVSLSRIPHWVKITSPKPEQILQGGQTLHVSGTVTKQALFNTTIEIAIFYRNPKLQHPSGFLVSQNVHVAKDGAFTGELTIPTHLSTSGTEFYLMFIKKNSQGVFTDQFYIPLKLNAR